MASDGNDFSLDIRLTINIQLINEQRHEKTSILHLKKTKMQISFAVTVKLITPLFSLHE